MSGDTRVKLELSRHFGPWVGRTRGEVGVHWQAFGYGGERTNGESSAQAYSRAHERMPIQMCNMMYCRASKTGDKLGNTKLNANRPVRLVRTVHGAGNIKTAQKAMIIPDKYATGIPMVVVSACKVVLECM